MDVREFRTYISELFGRLLHSKKIRRVGMITSAGNDTTHLREASA